MSFNRIACPAHLLVIHRAKPAAGKGFKQLGEMELEQFKESGIISCLIELENRFDMCVVNVYHVCNILLMKCQCNDDKIVVRSYRFYSQKLPMISIELIERLNIIININVYFFPIGL